MEGMEAESREASYFIPSLSKKIRNDRQMDERKESEGEGGQPNTGLREH